MSKVEILVSAHELMKNFNNAEIVHNCAFKGCKLKITKYDEDKKFFELKGTRCNKESCFYWTI